MLFLKRRLLDPLLAVALCASAVQPASAALGVARAEVAGKAGPAPVRLAQGGCSAAASQAAAQSGGQVLSVVLAQQNGQSVCIVTLLVPGRDGGRPRRVTMTVPQ